MSADAKHPYHMVNPSPWPALGALSALTLAVGAVFYFHDKPLFGVNGITKLVPGFVLLIITMVVWWRDIIRESVKEKAHTTEVSHGLRVGMVLFIASEVMFFFAFFWAFFDSSLYPDTGVWPPADIVALDPFDLPLINTLILLLSGCTVTWSHHALQHNNRKDFIRGLVLTIILGAIFIAVQAYEYQHATF